jgi:hypothetical protein
MNTPGAYPEKGTPFEAIVQQTDWNTAETAHRLHVVHDLGSWLVRVGSDTTNSSIDPGYWGDTGIDTHRPGARNRGDGGWLIHIGEDGTNSLVGFSVEAVDSQAPLRPPKDVSEVATRLGHVTVGLFNTDMTAKGVGSLVADTPYALQPYTIKDADIAVRMLPLEPNERVAERAPAGRVWGLLRHGGLLVASTLVDRTTQSHRGTAWATHLMEQPYGDARLVRMPRPPIWQLQQIKAGVVQPIPAEVLLVRGGTHADESEMTRIGTYRAHRSAA